MLVVPFIYQFFIQFAAVLTALVVWERYFRRR